MHPKRMPRGYMGTDHETIGSDILAVLATLSHPEQVLGEELAHALRGVKPDRWYPIRLLLEAMDCISDKVGRAGLLHMGQELFRMSHAAQFRKFVHSIADLVYGFDAMYRRANRGTDIGGYEVVRLVPGYAEFVKTSPQHCVMEEGMLAAELAMLDIPAEYGQIACLRDSADHCRYVLRSRITDDRWMGGRPPFDSPGGRR